MRALFALLAVLAALPAAAGPRVDRPPGLGAASPSIVRVNIVGRRPDGSPDDRRGTLAALAGTIGLSPEEAERIRASTGTVLCMEEGAMKPLASAVLVGDGSAVVTAAHVLRDPRRDGAPLPKGTACLFRTQTRLPETIPMRLDDSEVLGPGGRDDIWDPSDYAVVRLARRPADPASVPFAIAPVPRMPGAPVLLVSAFQADLRDRLGTAEPIVQMARLEVIGSAEGGAPRPLYLSGAMDAGGSGGAMLVRDRGSLALAGIVSTTGAVNRNGFAFSLQMMSFIRVIAVEGKFRDAIDALALARLTPMPASVR